MNIRSQINLNIWLIGLLLFGFCETTDAATLKIQPYAQWTFDTPIENVIYRPAGTGFPIRILVTEQNVVPYDSIGNRIREIQRSPADKVIINSESGFMLVQVNPSNQIDPSEKLYSFRIYDLEGTSQYTLIESVDLNNGILNYQLTDDLSILSTEGGKAQVLDMNSEDTLLYIQSCRSGVSIPGMAFTRASRLHARNELVTAVTCQSAADTAVTELSLWNHDHLLQESIILSGELKAMNQVPRTDYYFLELGFGAESVLTLFHRLQSIKTYPWKTWNIERVDGQTMFIVSERDFNLINLGDGTLLATYHPIDMSTISDATYLPEWGIFLYIRYESYYTESGRQAYRNFQLEGVNKSGKIIHRSSFGTWTYSLPKLEPVGPDLFAVQIHNSILMYGIELHRD